LSARDSSVPRPTRHHATAPSAKYFTPRVACRLSGRRKSEEKEKAKKTKGENEQRDREGVGKEGGEGGKGESLLTKD